MHSADISFHGILDGLGRHLNVISNTQAALFEKEKEYVQAQLALAQTLGRWRLQVAQAIARTEEWVRKVTWLGDTTRQDPRHRGS